MATIPEFEEQLARAVRNFTLCVLQIQGPRAVILFTSVEVEWRAKANRLQCAIKAAEMLAANGTYDPAYDILKKENEPT